MPRSLLVLALVFAVLAPASAKDKEKQAEAQVRVALNKYLAARFQGAPVREYGPMVMWTADEEPPCTTAVASYNITDIRLRDKDTALATVVFYDFGSYCPASDEFKPTPQLEQAIFQLRHRSILWLVEKTNRPGGQVDWHIVRDWMRLDAVDASLPAEKRGRARSGQLAIDRVATIVGRNGDSH